ncbi:MAG: 3-hydroxybutyryl-CoA dehydrogenase [candidate division Zixibacteria bacterium]|nr:3-hydroxybutyryl-CoA dehydrogenase [candidate division Zixibacteria bacterium]
MSIERIVVIGAGTMGQGISRTVAATGIDVILYDLSEEILENSIQALSESLDREIEKWGITIAEKKAILARIKTTVDINNVKKARMLIEAVPEELEIKKKLITTIDDLCPPETIFVSNTSTLSISELASYTKRPERFIGMHFLNPVHKIPLVEVVRGLKTSDETFQIIKEFALRLDKTPVLVHEYPGYVTTRIIVPFLNEAMHVLMEGISTAEEIDEAMKLGFGFNMGPLALADMMGLDEVMSWMENLIKELSEHKYNPCPLLRKMVRAGHLGVKTRQGFFCYDEEGNRVKEEEK